MGVVTTLPWSRPLTRHDLAGMPDDGHRYELLDGALLVTPAPSYRHQMVVPRLWRLLERERPSGLRVLLAPFDVVLADDTVLQPDVLVARRKDFTDRDLPAAPLLAVEVLSPSTRRIDQLLKPARYAAAGVKHYWTVDPIEPTLSVYELGPGDTYREVAVIRANESYAAKEPFAVTINPAELVADA
jgi:Uma2 family endonuclease